MAKYFNKIAIAPLLLAGAGAAAGGALFAGAITHSWKKGTKDAKKDLAEGKASYRRGTFRPKSFVYGDPYRYSYIKEVRKARKNKS